jgi:hypothetical protein
VVARLAGVGVVADRAKAPEAADKVEEIRAPVPVPAVVREAALGERAVVQEMREARARISVPAISNSTRKVLGL